MRTEGDLLWLIPGELRIESNCTMPNLPPFIAELFASPGLPREPVRLQWWLIQRKEAPFLLLPKPARAARVGLKIYSPQRTVARLGRSLLRLTLGTPVCSLFPPASIQVDATSDLMQFIAAQPGAAPGHNTPAIIMGNLSVQKQRFVILVCDERMRPVSVIKAGVKPEAQALIEREANLLSQLPPHAVGSIRLTGRLSANGIKAFSMPYYSGDNPRNGELLGFVLLSWLNPGPPVPIGSLRIWQELAAGCSGMKDFGVLKNLLAGERVQTAIQHGDFTPWNIRVSADGVWAILDWERGDLKGMPGWDWFHFVIQSSILVQRHTTERTAAEVERLIASGRYADYAATARISHITRPLALAYLAYQNHVVKPDEGHVGARALYELLAARWRLSTVAQSTGGDTKLAAAEPALASSSGLASLPPAGGMTRPSPARVPADLAQPAGKTAYGSWLGGIWQTMSWLLTHRNDGAGHLPSAHPRPALIKWITIAVTCAMFAGIAALHTFFDPRMTYLPLYLVPCALLTLVVNRRWGTVAAIVSAAMGPWFQSRADPDFSHYGVLLWNCGMRFLVLEIFVLLLDRVRVELNSSGQGNISK